MEWADTLQKSIVYIEGHLREEINIDELAQSNLIFIKDDRILKSIELTPFSWNEQVINWGQNFIFNNYLLEFNL